MTALPVSLRNHWFAACASRALRRAPIARTILDTPIVLFRAGQGPAALLDRCPHRNAPLSQGRLIDAMLRCPYHGWTFDAQGQCRHIPGLAAPSEHPARRAPSIPAVERDGLVWVYIGDSQADPPPLPPSRHAAVDDRSIDRFIWATQAQCSLVDGLENLLDATHPHFVHAGLVRASSRRRRVTVTVRRDAQMVEAVYVEDGISPGLIPHLLEGRRTASIGRFFPPSTAQLEYLGPQGPRFILTALFTPCDQRRVLVHAIVSTPRRWTPPLIKNLLLKSFLTRVLHQDQKILRRQQSNIERFGGPVFASTPLDVMRPHILWFLDPNRGPESADHLSTLVMEL